jgi:hypothetical protein
VEGEKHSLGGLWYGDVAGRGWWCVSINSFSFLDSGDQLCGRKVISGTGIVSAFSKLFDRVQDGFEYATLLPANPYSLTFFSADIHAFGDQDETLGDHEKNVLDKRDEMLRQVRETIVAGSGSLLSGSLSTVAGTNDN